MGVRLCRVCGVRPCQPSRMKVRDYRCGRCFNDTPAMRRYLASPRAKAVKARHNAVNNPRRIMLNRRQYYGLAPTIASAQTINAHIKRRRLEFIERQSSRAQAEGRPAGTVPVEASPGADRLGGG